MNWTQPICIGCYLARYPDRSPYTIRNAEPETCCDCGAVTLNGIYFRADPRTVRFPKSEQS